MSDIWLFVGGLFLAGAAIIAVFGRRAGGLAGQAELWAYFRSEFLIVAAVLVPAALHPSAIVVLVAAAVLRFGWEIRRASARRAVPDPALDWAFFAAVVLAAGALMAVATLPQGPRLLVLMFVCTEVQDALAFLSGRIFGRTHFLPRLSPRKTLEGTIGGVLGGLIAGSAFAHHYLQWDWAQSLSAAGVCTLGGIAGDLLPSAYKRHVGIKDFQPVHRLHGGLLDVYDSLVFCAPCMLAWLWLPARAA